MLTEMQAAEDGTVTMGEMVTKLVETANTYRECRAAALAH